MKRITYILTVVLMNLLVLSSCDRENYSFDNGGNSNVVVDNDKAEGTISFASIKLSIMVDGVTIGSTTRGEEETTSVDVSNFIITVKNNDKVTVASWKYSEMPDIFAVKVGTYYIEAASYDGEEKDAILGTPYYFGSTSIEIKENTVSEVTNLQCSLQSIMVTIEYDDNLKELLNVEKDAQVEVSNGSNGEKLTFYYNSDNVGYFKSKSSNVLFATLTATIDGSKVSYTQSFSGVKGGEHRVIRFSIKTVDITDTNQGGTASFGITIVTTCEKKEVTVDITQSNGSEVKIEDFPEEKDDDEEDNNSGNQGGDSEVNTKPSMTGYIIPANGTYYEEFNFNNVIGTSTISALKVDISAPKGIKNLYVTIDADVTGDGALSESELKSFGLTQSFDLANPGDLEGGLSGLGFPTGEDVKNQTSVTFDISQFISLLGTFQAEHHFGIKVIDNAGNELTKTLKIDPRK